MTATTDRTEAPELLATGHRRLLEQLRADGVRFLFGNPGSSEEGLLDEIARFPDIDYVLGLQEAAVVCTADGYAQATGRPGVVLLHSGVGLGNAVGSLYHALHRQTPMLVMAGEAGVAYDALEAHMSVNLVDIAEPVTKYATRVTHPDSLLRLVRRCLKVAATPPRGPVFLALPQDVLDQISGEPVVPTTVPDTRVVPEPGAIQSAARLLAGAHNPVIIVGDGIAASGAVAELTRFAEIWGAVVHGAMASELLMPWTHPLWGGLTGHMFGDGSASLVAQADAVLICGTYVFPDVFPDLENPFRPGATVVHVDLDPYAIAKNHPVTTGMLGDPRLTLHALTGALEEAMTDPQRHAAAERVHRRTVQRTAEVDRALTDDLGAGRNADSAPLRMSAVAAALAALLPDDAIVFDEALTNSPALTRWLPPTRPGHFFQTPGGTLGVGIPGAIGAKIAHPERTVVGFTGDGGGMYTCQALWTAAHHRIGAKFVVCHNGGYQLLKDNLEQYRQDHDDDPGAAFPPFFDVREPRVDYVNLAAGMGVPAARARHAADLPTILRTMLDHDGPYLVEAVLDDPGDTP
ncbi:thiamine pyrophosphate-binding protein [Actinoplanes hulinensis]|uniref:Thiamine pyrophosphate-binding protein n=1 Tax=Actinoplanes hulinensis TaxID=1144547 RepID=A0ABS7B1Z8_9ACTN|nr:thiamine pyrophosphate-binding protein [Actinoplanes hulinensis]MBW6435018.1 thiamine pyrophosphate-binding protein [Actinoplanes hulinensis]